jgi:hypothetical protein
MLTVIKVNSKVFLIGLLIVLCSFVVSAADFDIDIPDSEDYCNCDADCEDADYYESCLVEGHDWLAVTNTKSGEYMDEAHDAGYNGVCVIVKLGKEVIRKPISNDCEFTYEASEDEDEEKLEEEEDADDGLEIVIAADDEDDDEPVVEDEDDGAEIEVVTEEDEDEKNLTVKTFFGVDVFQDGEGVSGPMNNATRVAIAVVAICFFVLIGWLAYLFKSK